MFIRTWYPVSVPNFYNPVTSLLLPTDQKEKWQGMRSVGQLRKDLGLKAPVNADSLYKVSHLLYFDIQRSFSHDDGIKSVTREFKQIATADAATAIAVEEIWGEYVAVARQNSTLSNAKYKQYGEEVLKLISVFEEVFVRLKTLNDFVQRHKGFYFTLL